MEFLVGGELSSALPLPRRRTHTLINFGANSPEPFHIFGRYVEPFVRANPSILEPLPFSPKPANFFGKITLLSDSVLRSQKYFIGTIGIIAQ